MGTYITGSSGNGVPLTSGQSCALPINGIIAAGNQDSFFMWTHGGVSVHIASSPNECSSSWRSLNLKLELHIRRRLRLRMKSRNLTVNTNYVPIWRMLFRAGQNNLIKFSLNIVRKGPIGYESTLVTSHYVNQWWSRPWTRIHVTMPPCVNWCLLN